LLLYASDSPIADSSRKDFGEFCILLSRERYFVVSRGYWLQSAFNNVSGY
jgi:hypothetical protein